MENAFFTPMNPPVLMCRLGPYSLYRPVLIYLIGLDSMFPLHV